MRQYSAELVQLLRRAPAGAVQRLQRLRQHGHDHVAVARVVREPGRDETEVDQVGQGFVVVARGSMALL